MKFTVESLEEIVDSKGLIFCYNEAKKYNHENLDDWIEWFITLELLCYEKDSWLESEHKQTYFSEDRLAWRALAQASYNQAKYIQEKNELKNNFDSLKVFNNCPLAYA